MPKPNHRVTHVVEVLRHILVPHFELPLGETTLFRAREALNSSFGMRCRWRTNRIATELGRQLPEHNRRGQRKATLHQEASHHNAAKSYGALWPLGGARPLLRRTWGCGPIPVRPLPTHFALQPCSY